MTKKFENVDVIDTLRKIMLHNTIYYQTDFDYDVRQLTDAAESSTASRSFLWMSRDSGTWCFSEREVYIKNTSPYNSWQFYRNEKSVKAFWIELGKYENKKVMGTVCEIDYLKHVEQAKQSALQPQSVELVFKKPAAVRVCDFEEYDTSWYSIHCQYGDIYSKRYLVENEYVLQNIIDNSKAACFEQAQPASVDDYVRDMVREHFHSKGYTTDDMAYVIPDDVYEAVRQGIPAYALYPDNVREPIMSVKEADKLNGNGTLFGIRYDDKKLLDYFVERPSMKGELFSHEEFKQLYSCLLQAGKADDLDENGRNLLDRMICKLDKIVSPVNSEEYEIQPSLDYEAQGGFEHED